MDDPQIIRTPSGDELVVLPRADYDALVAAAAEAEEDAADVAMYDACKAELAAGRDTILPADLSALLLQHGSLLTALRVWRRLSPADLAERANLSMDELDDLEQRRTARTVDVAERLARALDADPRWLRPD